TTNNPHLIFGQALCLFIVGFIIGVIGLILVWIVRRDSWLWALPVLGVVLNIQCSILALVFWVLTGMGIR
ncbi:MAG: hypothetical protein WCS42_17550, partial [Verrucomicrobiota bacterium]